MCRSGGFIEESSEVKKNCKQCACIHVCLNLSRVYNQKVRVQKQINHRNFNREKVCE